MRESNSMFSVGVRTLLDPPPYDDLGRSLRGAVIFSSQFNKGEWGHRPKTLSLGDIVLSIGDVKVLGGSDFYKAVNRYQGRTRDQDLVEVKVFAQRPDDSGAYEVQIREMDPGDFRLIYGVYSLRSGT